MEQGLLKVTVVETFLTLGCRHPSLPLPRPLDWISHDPALPACWKSRILSRRQGSGSGSSRPLCECSRTFPSGEGTAGECVLFMFPWRGHCSAVSIFCLKFFYHHSSMEDLGANRILTGPVPKIERTAGPLIGDWIKMRYTDTVSVTWP